MRMRSLANALPRLAGLPDELWERRHRGIVAVLWLHVPALAAYGLLTGRTVTHMVDRPRPARDHGAARQLDAASRGAAARASRRSA